MVPSYCRQFLDCTLLPLVSIAIPALSWGVGLVTRTLGGVATTAAAATGGNSVVAALSSVLAYLPALSHGIALYFVTPVGLLTTLVNYFFGHKEARLSSLSLVGVALIFAANSSAGVGVPIFDAWLRSAGIAAAHGAHAHASHTHAATRACSEGLAHCATNTLGCALLLGVNYLGKQYLEAKNRGCATSALAVALGGRVACPPGCNCGRTRIYGANANRRLKYQGRNILPVGEDVGRKQKREAGRGLDAFACIALALKSQFDTVNDHNFMTITCGRAIY